MFQLCDSPLTPATSVGDGVSSPSSSYTQEDDAREFAFDSLPPSGISSDVSYGENLAKDFPLSFSDTKYVGPIADFKAANAPIEFPRTLAQLGAKGVTSLGEHSATSIQGSGELPPPAFTVPQQADGHEVLSLGVDDGIIKTVDAPQGIYFCRFRCEHVSSTIEEARQHYSSSHGRFACTCGKRFKHKHDARRHATTATNGRIYPCAYCPKMFVRKDARDCHLKICKNARNANEGDLQVVA